MNKFEKNEEIPLVICIDIQKSKFMKEKQVDKEREEK